MYLDAAVDDLAQFLFVDEEIHLEQETVLRNGAVHITKVLGDGLVENDAAHCGVDDSAALCAVDLHGTAHPDLGLQRDNAFLIGHDGLVFVAEHLTFALVSVVDHGEVIAAQYHILGRHCDGLAVSRLEQVAGSQHQAFGLTLRFLGKGHVHSHLVAVKVRVERSADQRMQLDGAAFHQHRLERLNAKAVQRRRAVEHNGMALDDGFQRVPHFGAGALHHLAGRLDVVGNALFHKILHDEGFEQLQRHLLGQAALVHLQLRADDDNRTAGVVHAFAQQVLAEAALLALEHVGQALERTVVGAGHRTAAAAVVDEGVHRLLQHTLFVAHNDIRSAQLQQTLQTVVAVDDAAVQVVQVGRGKTSAVQLDHRADIGRNDRDDVHDHPLRTVAGDAERLHDFQPLEQAHALLAACFLQFLMQLFAELFQVDLLQQLLHGLCAHCRLELVLVALTHVAVLFFAEQLLFLQRCEAGIGHDICGKVQHLFQQARADIQHQADAGRDPLEIPDMRNGRGQLDMAHTLAAHLGARHFNAAAVADLTLVADALVLAAVAFPVLRRPKNALTEQAVALRFQGAVVDGLGLFHLAVAPGTDLIRGGKTDLD